LHQLLNLADHPDLLRHPALGASWEALVLQQLAFHLPPGYEVFFYRTHDGAEADFVLTNGGKPEILIEVKFSSAPSVSKGFFNIASALNTSTNYILAPVTHPFPAKNGLEVIGLKQIPGLFQPAKP
jgi:uncharacterized protein